MTPNATHAVLMGDLVGSERAPSGKALHRSFNKAVDAANKDNAAAISSPLTITLGDEFQGVLGTLLDSWHVAAAMRLRLLREGIACRFVIGTIKLETPLNTERAWNMMGPGLGAARDKLNDKSSEIAYRFSLPDEPIIEPLMDAVGHSLTQVERGWTPTQLEYYATTRESSRTNVDIAKGLEITPRSLYKVLHAAHADFHTRQSQVLAAALGHLDERYGLK